MNKTIYLRDEDVAVWEKAKEIAGDKLSQVIVSALRQYVGENEAQKQGFERIVLEFQDAEKGHLPQKKAFYGRWITSPKQPTRVTDEGDSVYYGAVAETQKGNIVVFEREETSETVEHKFRVFASFEEAAKTEFGYAARAAFEKRGVPVEELDI